MSTHKVLLTLFCFLLSFIRGIAQTDSIVFHPVNNKALQKWDIRKFCVAKDGKLWLSTGNGVASFDGSEVRFFGRGEGGNMVMNTGSISRSYFDSLGNLFCLISGGDIFYLHTKTGQVERLNIYIAAEDSSAFFVPIPYTEMLIDGRYLWVGRNNMGFMCYDLVTKQTQAYNIYPHQSHTKVTSIRKDLTLDDKNKTLNTVTSIQKDWKRDELLWLGTSNGIYSFNKKTRELKRNFRCSNPIDSSSSDVEILKININRADTIWFTAAGKGVGCYEIKTGRYIMYPYHQGLLAKKNIDLNIIFFQRKDNDEYYIGMREKPPGIFNIYTHEYTFNSRFSGNFPSYNINHFVADSAGNLWCLLFNQLYMASTKRNKFSAIFIHDIDTKSITTNVLTKVIWDDKQKYYYAAFDNSDAIFVLDSNKRFVKSIPVTALHNNKEEITETSIYDIALDEKGRLWACGNPLNVYDSVTKRMVPVQKLYPQILFGDPRFQSVVARGNYVYLQPSNRAYKAIYRIDISRCTYDSIPLPENITSSDNVKIEAEKFLDPLHALIIDKQGRYAYMCVYNNVIQIDLRTKKVNLVTIVMDKGYKHFFNMQWYALDDDNRLCIFSGQGILVYNTNSFQPIKHFKSEKDAYPQGLCHADGKGVICELNSQGVVLRDYRNNRKYHLAVVDGLTTLFNSSISCVNNTLFVGAELNALQYISLGSVVENNKERNCRIADIQLFNEPYFTDTLPEYLHSITLPHDQNTITLTFSCTEFQQAPALIYRYKLEGIDNYWRYAYTGNTNISYNNLAPGNYTFTALVMNPDNKWSKEKARIKIHILPAWWQTNLFKILCIVTFLILAYLVIRWRIRTVRAQERLKNLHEKELLELEAKALRAQMNPHFIFNCMNSIKSLIQQKDEASAVSYLTTFSKLIRTIFQNSDKREISLFDEIETCRLYTQLESMRFGNKLAYSFSVDETIDLKSLLVPALIIQPFIENAIWHGIMPKEDGGTVTVTVEQKDENILCIIEDNGIGRESSNLNKFKGDPSMHQSKGVHLTQSRLDLDNLLSQRKAYLKIVDKKDEFGKAKGTTVVLSFTEY